MFKNKKFFALVIARKDSKRLKNKNLLKLKNKSLIYWSIKSCLRSRYLDQICLSTNIGTIKDINNFKKKILIDKRPKSLSTSSSSVYSLIDYILKKYDLRKKFDYLVLLQASSPYRNSNNIDEAIKKFTKNRNSNLVSVTKLESKYNHVFSKENKKKFFYKKSKNIYVPNGAIFITNLKNKIKNFYINKLTFFEMPYINSIDIDTIYDYKMAQLFQNKLK